MMPLAGTKPQEHAVIYSDLESGYGITVAVKTTTNWAKIIWWDGTEEVKEPSIGSYETFGKIVFFKISDTNASKRIVAYSTDSSGNKSGTIQMFTCYRHKDKRKRPGGNYYIGGRGDYYAENQKVTKLDVSTCSDLRVLKCDRNQLTSLGDITACRLVETIACAGNCFENLDLSRMQNLDQLYCNFNTNLSTLSTNSGLRRLGASSTAINSGFSKDNLVQMNLRDCPGITLLDLDTNSSVLYANFDGCANLTSALFTDMANLHHISFKNCTSLTNINFSNSGFTSSATTVNFGTKSYNYNPANGYDKHIIITNNSGMTTSDVESMYSTLPTVDTGYIRAFYNSAAANADDTEATNRNWTVFT